MRNLELLLGDVIALLQECGMTTGGDWYCSKRDELRKAKKGSAVYNDLLKKIDHSLAGMGSFSDMPLVPQKGSLLTEEIAEKKQLILINEISETINHLLKERP
jgi:hypothetical protein